MARRDNPVPRTGPHTLRVLVEIEEAYSNTDYQQRTEIRKSKHGPQTALNLPEGIKIQTLNLAPLNPAIIQINPLIQCSVYPSSSIFEFLHRKRCTLLSLVCKGVREGVIFIGVLHGLVRILSTVRIIAIVSSATRGRSGALIVGIFVRGFIVTIVREGTTAVILII